MPSTKQCRTASQTADWQVAGLLYHSLNSFYRKKFGTKVWKLSLDAGCNCPNRDGTLGTLGCVFCDPASFSPSRRLGLASVAQQVQEGIRRLKRRYAAERFVAYFQPGTNTYGPIDRLRLAYEEAISHPNVVGLAIGTRPDCVSEEILDLLERFASSSSGRACPPCSPHHTAGKPARYTATKTVLAEKTWVVVEYGLQTIHDRTLDLLNRGHHYDAFLDAYQRTRRRDLDVAVHVILGLPGESRDDMRATARELARLEIHSVKLHNLYAVRNTVLAEQVAAGHVRPPEFQEYIECVVDFLEELPSHIVIERLCGDAPPEYLVGPAWCLDKAAVRSAVEAEFRRRGTWQGYKAKG